MKTSEAAALLACVRHLREADALLITAGAGMGVDSGLPDFRGEGGFWRHYPALGRAGLDFHAIASPEAFAARPRLAWGFYGHRLQRYRHTVPHAGFGLLRTWSERFPHAAFVFTSNVDGQFQAAGFAQERIMEVHGSLHHLQCLADCGSGIWTADGFDPQVDEERCELVSGLPRCPRCGALARPNVLMFGDGGWVPDRSDAQAGRLRDWLSKVRRPVILEIGAGMEVPTVRRFGESVGGALVRVNPREPEVPPGGIGLRMNGLQALQAIDAVWRQVAA